MGGSTVTLDGRNSSDANGDALTFSWTLTSKPTGSNAPLVLTTSSPTPTFTADVAGYYVASLIVNDGKVNSSPETVAISARTRIFTTDCASCHTTQKAQDHMAAFGPGCNDCHGPGALMDYHSN